MCQSQWLVIQTIPKGSQHRFMEVGLSMVAMSYQLPQELLPPTGWDLGVATSQKR